jgi:surface protein
MKGDGGAGIRDLDVSNLTSLASMFTTADKFNQPIGGWDTSNVTSMYWMFKSAKGFNQYIGDWDTSKVVTMDTMFHYAEAFDQDISTKTVTRDDGSTYTAWDTSSVTTMGKMFENGYRFQSAHRELGYLQPDQYVLHVFQYSSHSISRSVTGTHPTYDICMRCSAFSQCLTKTSASGTRPT